jgi:hypothetical protein
MSNIDTLTQQVDQIKQSLDGTIAQIGALNRKIEESSKTFMESLAVVNEDMRLILEVIRKQRLNVQDDLASITKVLKEEIEKLWKEKVIENLTQEQMEAIETLKSINLTVGDNLYMFQILSIVNSLRDISGRAVAIKNKKDG